MITVDYRHHSVHPLAHAGKALRSSPERRHRSILQGLPFNGIRQHVLGNDRRQRPRVKAVRADRQSGRRPRTRWVLLPTLQRARDGDA